MELETDRNNVALNRVARAVSGVLSTPIVPLLTVGLLLNINLVVATTEPASRLHFASLGLMFMTVAPLLILLFLKLMGVLDSVGGASRRQSTIVCVVYALCYLTGWWVFRDSNILFLLRKYMMVATATMCAAGVVSLFTDISLDMVSWGASLAAFWILFYVGCTGTLGIICTIVALSGVAGSALLATDRQTPASVAIGMVTGLLVGAVVMVLS